METIEVIDMRVQQYWTWFGDYQEVIVLKCDNCLAVNVFHFESYPDVKHIIPTESYSGSRFSGSGVYADELPLCKLLATAMML